jgi:hypothetical protein
MAHGTAPSSPNNGDLWTTTSGLFARINGVTYNFVGAGSDPLLLGNGLVTAPSYSFSGDTNTGMYHTGTADQLAFTTGGVQRLRIDAAVAFVGTLPWRGPDGDVSAPTFAFSSGVGGGTGTGWYRHDTGGVSLAMNGAHKVSFMTTETAHNYTHFWVNSALSGFFWRRAGTEGDNADASYAVLQINVLDSAAGSEDAEMLFSTSIAGAVTQIMALTAGVRIGNPTGGDKGAGTLNLDNDLYKDGIKVVGAQGAAVADATDAASAITQLNAWLARARAHGLVAT